MKKLLKYFLSFCFLTMIAQAEENKPTLVVYTYDSFTASWGPAPKVKEALKKIVIVL